MSDKKTDLKNLETRRRLALLGLAAEQPATEQPCPDDVQFAQLLDADLGSAEQQHFFEHLSVCQHCREKWLVLTAELGGGSDHKTVKSGLLHGRRGLMSLVGSACAVAVGVMLYLSIDQRPIPFVGTVSPTQERALEAPADRGSAQNSEVTRTDGIKSEADPAQPSAEATRYQQEAVVQQTARVKTSPAPQRAAPPVEQSQPEEALSDQQSFSAAAGAKAQTINFQEFIDSFLSYCGVKIEGGSRAARPRNLVQQAEELLHLEGAMTPDQMELAKKVVQLLSRSEPVKDTELDKLCDEAERLEDETDQARR